MEDAGGGNVYKEGQSIFLFVSAVFTLFLSLVMFLLAMAHVLVYAAAPKLPSDDAFSGREMVLIVGALIEIMGASLGVAGLRRNGNRIMLAIHFILNISSSVLDLAMMLYSGTVLIGQDNLALFSTTKDGDFVTAKKWYQSLMTIVVFFILFAMMHGMCCIISASYVCCCARIRPDRQQPIPDTRSRVVPVQTAGARRNRTPYDDKGTGKKVSVVFPVVDSRTSAPRVTLASSRASEALSTRPQSNFRSKPTRNDEFVDVSNSYDPDSMTAMSYSK